MDWSVQSINEQNITISLNFSLPLIVSYSRNAKDNIKFAILQPELFIGEISGK